VEYNNSKISAKKLTPLMARQRIENWCAYQERSQQDVRNKLYEYGLHESDVEEIITELISNNFLNEERFAIAFAGGKFRMKKWGKIKIKVELRAKKVSDYCINKALKQIPDNDYLSTLEKVVSQKMRQVKEPNKIKKHYKLIQYASSRGFEKDLIVDVLKEMEK
jgi:regulatory protein